MGEDRDELIDSISAALRPLPAVDDTAKARLLVAVAAERARDRERAAHRASRGLAVRWMGRGAGLAAAAALVVVLLRPATVPTIGVTPVATAPAARPAVTLATATAADPSIAPQDVQLVYRAPDATRVRVVGDFNSWDAQRAPMTRDAATGLWTVTLSLKPGRHVYAFVVDDTLWMRDPRAPAAQDADFGRPGSVLLVGRP